VGWFHQDQRSLATYGRIQDGADFRRARLSAKGSVTETINYFFQMDFAFFGRPTFTDVWVEQTGVPLLGNFRVGQWKQPFSLEVVSSFRYTTFMERSLLFLPFTPFRHIGVGFYDHADDLRATWAASLFRSGQDQYGGSISTDGGWGTAERVTFLPYWDETGNGRSYVHLGVGHFFNAPPDDTVNFRTVPEFFIGQHAPGGIGTSGQPVPGVLHGTPFFVVTGPLTVNAYNVIGAEFLGVAGALSLQSEVMVNFVDQGAGNPGVVLPGAYAQVGWFLTGEHRPYDRKAGAIDRVIPHHNFIKCDHCGEPGCGAWEIAARWSHLDLNDENVQGGRITDYTVGVNWYLNPYTKVVFNYIRATPDRPVEGRSHTDMFGLRTQLDF
jgi:phosphate-selective porin OprO/OprP